MGYLLLQKVKNISICKTYKSGRKKLSYIIRPEILTSGNSIRTNNQKQYLSMEFQSKCCSAL
jgi:hypothetical protein